MIDTHAHLNFEQLSSNLEEVLKRAKLAGVTTFVVPGTDEETSRSAVDLAQQYPEIFAAVGIHPTDAADYGPNNRAWVRELSRSAKVKAIGEVGLDYYRLPINTTEESDVVGHKQAQQELFGEMIAIAYESSLPLIVHSREAFADTARMLKELAPNHPTVLHCFVGSTDEAKQYLDLGCHLSLTAIITYPKNQELREIAASIPLDRLMLETDAPFLPPHGKRGEIGEPQYVRAVAECLAEVRGVSVEEIDRKTSATAKAFFKI
jgi:TatD DNase family protein